MTKGDTLLVKKDSQRILISPGAFLALSSGSWLDFAEHSVSKDHASANDTASSVCFFFEVRKSSDGSLFIVPQSPAVLPKYQPVIIKIEWQKPA